MSALGYAQAKSHLWQGCFFRRQNKYNDNRIIIYFLFCQDKNALIQFEKKGSYRSGKIILLRG